VKAKSLTASLESPKATAATATATLDWIFHL
jgi:hypothetical protein